MAQRTTAWLKGMPFGPALESETTAKLRFRHGEQFGELAVGRPAVADGANAVDVPQKPADAEGVTEGAAVQLDGRFLHPMHTLRGQYLFAAFRMAVAEVEPGPP